MPLKSDYNHIICIMDGETKNIRFVLKIYRFVLRLLNISFCRLYLFCFQSLPILQTLERILILPILAKNDITYYHLKTLIINH